MAHHGAVKCEQESRSEGSWPQPAGKFRERFILMEPYFGRNMLGDVELWQDKHLKETHMVTHIGLTCYKKEREVAACQRLQGDNFTDTHKYILSMVGWYLSYNSWDVVNLSGTKVPMYLVYEPGIFETLYQRLERNKGAADRVISETQVLMIIHSLLMAVAFLHEKGVVHRYVSLKSMYCTAKTSYWPIKLFNFSNAEVVEQGTPFNYMQDPAGSFWFSDPQQLKCLLKRAGWVDIIIGVGYTHKCDIYSVGLVLQQLLEGKIMFSDIMACGKPSCQIKRPGGKPSDFINCASCQYNRLCILRKFKYEIDEHILGNKLKPTTKSLLSKLISYNPSDRPEAAEALEHPALQGEVFPQRVVTLSC